MKFQRLGFLVVLTACTSWHVVETPAPAQLVAREQPKKLLVTRQDGSRIELSKPDVHGDTLIGHRGTGLALSDTAREIRVPVSSIRSVAVRRPSAGKTIALIAGIGLGIAAMIRGVGESLTLR